MADFVQTMKDWMRMCEHCDRNEKIGCVVNGNVCVGFCKMKDDIDLEAVEAKVTAWAAEHPEPVYPTFAEWLYSIGVTISDRPFPTPNIPVYVFQVNAKMFEPIPADIAEKLGIEPKE